MKVKTTEQFFGIPKDTTGNAELDGHLLKVTWGIFHRGEALYDWFNADDAQRYLRIID